MPWALKERTALITTLRAANPDGPTLCEGWNVRRLLAQLVQREQDLVGTVGDQLTRDKPGREHNLTKLTDAARTPDGYAALVDRFGQGAPAWSPLSWATEQINLLEYVVHHEDIRRAGIAPSEPRVLPDSQQQSVWGPLSVLGRLVYLRCPVGVTLAQPGGKTKVVKKAEPAVTLTGEPVELALYANGRRGVARVEVTGPPEAVERFTDWVAGS